MGNSINVDKNPDIEAEFEVLKSRFSGLYLERQFPNYIISGDFSFTIKHENEFIQDSFDVLATILPDYPRTLPIVEERGGRIPKEFHLNPDKSLCLGAPLELKIIFSKNPILLGFFENCVAPYFYSFCIWSKTGIMPLGELSHGEKGIYESYSNIFNIKDRIACLKFLKVLAFDNYRGHLQCPCNSGKKLRMCHGAQLLCLGKHQTPKEFFKDMCFVLHYLKDYKEVKVWASKNLKKRS